MKRALLGTLWIGAIAAGLAIALQISGLLARPAAALGKAIGLLPNEAVGFWNFLFLILLSFTVAWTMLQVTGVARRAGLFALLILELLGAAWVLHAAHVSFPPLPAILAAIGATLLALSLPYAVGAWIAGIVLVKRFIPNDELMPGDEWQTR